jgi:hypothetical protein
MRATFQHMKHAWSVLDEQHAAGGEGQSAIKRFFKVEG